jgi:hypothetical protein
LIARPGKVKGDLTHMREGGPPQNIRKEIEKMGKIE